MKKALAILLGLVSITNVVFGATDMTQELDSNGGTLQVNNNLTINYDEGTFNETVVFSARTVSQIEGGIDASKFDDKGSEALYISFKNNIGLATIPQKQISLGYSDLGSYENPVLLTYKDGKLEVIEGEDNAGTYVYQLEGMIEGAYKVVESLSFTSSSTSNEDDLLSGIEDGIEFNSAPDEPVNNIVGETNEATSEVLLSDKPVKGTNDFYLLILALVVIVFGGIYYFEMRKA